MDVDEGVDVGGHPPLRCVRRRATTRRQVECPAAPLRRQLRLALAARKLAALRQQLVPDETQSRRGDAFAGAQRRPPGARATWGWGGAFLHRVALLVRRHRSTENAKPKYIKILAENVFDIQVLNRHVIRFHRELDQPRQNSGSSTLEHFPISAEHVPNSAEQNPRGEEISSFKPQKRPWEVLNEFSQDPHFKKQIQLSDPILKPPGT